MAQTFPYTPDPRILSQSTNVVQNADSGEYFYACPSACWTEHLSAWRHARRLGDKQAPCPMPQGHLMFERAPYGPYVPYGNTDPIVRRQALEASVRDGLQGWLEPGGKLDAIVAATVEAKMQGKPVGAAPWCACMYAHIDE